MDASEHLTNVKLPRVAITYCTQCRWMLRAAYFGQELLSTFGTSIGEIALIPATGGTFIVKLTYKPVVSENSPGDRVIEEAIIWDYKTERGFPETKILKQKIRNFIDPGRSLGHSDKPSSKAQSGGEVTTNAVSDRSIGGMSSSTAKKPSATTDEATSGNVTSKDGIPDRDPETSISQEAETTDGSAKACKDCD